MNNPIVKGQYQTADNPIFEVFYLADAHGVLADFSGNPPREYNLAAGSEQKTDVSQTAAPMKKKSFWQRLFS